MCGIAGYAGERLPGPETVGVMVEALRHRGPDDSGYYRREGYAVGMRRLAINDVHGGGQPLFSENKDVVLFYNGEIYNSPALRRELEAGGHVFRTRSDGEVICHLFEERGEDAFGLLDGMFAAALWVESEQKLILARDIPGEKPLYYARLPQGGLAFASEIKSLVLCPGVDASLDMAALWDFPTFLWIPEPDTVYAGIKALPRGSLLTLDRRGLRIAKYRHAFSRDVPADREELAAEIRRVATEAIQSRLLSDVPVGAFLSSGLDSSIIAAVASQKLPTLTTFTIGFEDLSDPYHGRADESGPAGEFAKRLGVENVRIRVAAADFRRDLLEFCAHGDQPFSVSSGLGVLAVSREARKRGVKVLLTGDGADEQFGGYSWYFHLGDCAGPGIGGGGPPEISMQDAALPIEKRLKALAAYPPQVRAWAWHYYASEADKAALYSREPFEDAPSSLRHFSAFKPDRDWTPEDYIRQDREFYFPNEMLRKADRMTMAHSVEGRVPFAAPPVLALADGLRYRDMVAPGTLKSALREAFSGLLPPEVANRPKHGFNVPIDHWLKNEWADLVADAFAPDSALSRLGLVTKQSGERARAMLGHPARLHGHTVFSFVMLNLWLENEYGNHR